MAAVALVTSVSVQAFDASCPEPFWKGVSPKLLKPKLSIDTRAICYAGYAVLHSGVTRTPLWAAEHLTAARIEAARATPRVNAFHPEPTLPPDERAELSDYAHSGFDRGHMAPAGDMPDFPSQEESFSLANIVPQYPEINRHLWEEIESNVRELVEREGELYVVTGPTFEGENLQSLNGRVLVPTRIFKAIYDPRRNRAGAYLARNAEEEGWQILSLADLRTLTGIDLFPTLSDDVKAKAMDLPKSNLRPKPRPPHEPTETSSTGRDDFVAGMLEAIDRWGRR